MWPLQGLMLMTLLSLVLAAEKGSSLRGVLRALQRRRRTPGPVGPLPLATFQDQELQQDLQPEDYNRNENENYYGGGIDWTHVFMNPNFEEMFKEYHSVKKRSSTFRNWANKQGYQSDRLKESFMRGLAEEKERERENARFESDSEYAELLRELWDKYKNTHPDIYSNEIPEDLEFVDDRRTIQKRQVPGEYTPSGWGPVAFKRKRSSNQRLDVDTPNDFFYSLKFVSQNDPSAVENLKGEKISDEDEDSDVSKMMYTRVPDPRFPEFEVAEPKPEDGREEYLLSLQPITNPDTPDDVVREDNEYIYEAEKEKRFPVSKRSSPYSSPLVYRGGISKRNSRTDKNKLYRSIGTDPRVMKDLSSIFGNKEREDEKTELILKPVKRSSVPDDSSHEVKPPTLTFFNHHHGNGTEHNHTTTNHHDDSHEHSREHDNAHEHEHEHAHPHGRHEHESKPPLLSSSGDGFDQSHENEENKHTDFDDTEETHIKMEHPIILKKKSIDWSNYFGIDKRKKKSVGNLNLDSLRNSYAAKTKKYMDKYSLKHFKLHDQPQPRVANIEPISENDAALLSQLEDIYEDKRDPKQNDQRNLDSMDNKLKNMETAIVNDALQYSDVDEGLETKEILAAKEENLARLTAAYSLDKMRKALKEFKMSLLAQRNAMKDKSMIEYEDDKEKRTPSEKPTDKHLSIREDPSLGKQLQEGDDPSNDQRGVGLLSRPAEAMSEGYMGGAGAEMTLKSLLTDDGSCPVLNRIIRRCHSVDTIAGDRGQLFLPLCSLHQICYLCGPSSATECDLAFLSEAESACGGRAACGAAARAAAGALRELHAPAGRPAPAPAPQACAPQGCLTRAARAASAWQPPYRR